MSSPACADTCRGRSRCLTDRALRERTASVADELTATDLAPYHRVRAARRQARCTDVSLGDVEARALSVWTASCPWLAAYMTASRVADGELPKA